MPLPVLIACIVTLLPLAAFAAQMVLTVRFPHLRDRLGGAIPVLAIGAGMVLSIFLFVSYVLPGHGIEKPFFWSVEWFAIGETATDLKVECSVLVDNLTILMLVVVTVVSFIVHVFSMGYMKEQTHDAYKVGITDRHGHPVLEPHSRYPRFFAYLALFSFSMLGLVITANLLFLFIFWELVGVCSYFLIGFDIERKAAGDAAIKAFITTRIGDLGFFLALLILIGVVGSFQIHEVFESLRAPAESNVWHLTAAKWGISATCLLSLTAILLFLGPVGKSAQFPLHVWLPDAMEGPTPVSALIHAATMVAAGVYLVGRMFPLFAGFEFFDHTAVDAHGGPTVLYASTPLFVVALVGGFTALFAATIAVAQNDIKKVLAYSTVSQLGYMMMGIGVGHFAAGLFHLFTHAFFKAALFLGSGSIIHSLHHEQDMQKMGGLWKKLPVTFATFLVSTLALAGLPFITAGFYSKEAVLTQAMTFGLANEGSFLHFLPFLMALFAAFLTAFYMLRCIMLTFFGAPRDRHKHEHAHEMPMLAYPLVPLALLAVFSGGFILLDGGHWFQERVNPELTFANFLAHVKEQEQSGRASSGGSEEGGDGEHVEAAGQESEAEKRFAEAHHEAHVPTMALSILAALVGMLAGAGLYAGSFKLRDMKGDWGGLSGFRRVLQNLWYVDWFYNAYFVRIVFVVKDILGFLDAHLVDRFVDWWGRLTVGVSSQAGEVDDHGVDGLVDGTGEAVLFAGDEARRVQTGRLQDYVYMTLFLLALIFIFLFFAGEVT